jgi:hypothetical protein
MKIIMRPVATINPTAPMGKKINGIPINKKRNPKLKNRIPLILTTNTI